MLIKCLIVYILVEVFEWLAAINGLQDSKSKMNHFQYRVYLISECLSYMLTLIIGSGLIYVIVVFVKQDWAFLLSLFIAFWIRDLITRSLVTPFVAKAYRTHEKYLRKQALRSGNNGHQQ